MCIRDRQGEKREGKNNENVRNENSPQAFARELVVIVAVFTLNRSFNPATSAVHPVSVLIHPRNTHFNPVFAVLYGLEDQTHYQVNEVNPRPTYLLVEPEHNKPAKHENKNHEH